MWLYLPMENGTGRKHMDQLANQVAHGFPDSLPAPEIERCLTDNGGYADAAYVTTEVIGVEVLRAREGK